jgi:hypothetical protein
MTLVKQDVTHEQENGELPLSSLVGGAILLTLAL